MPNMRRRGRRARSCADFCIFVFDFLFFSKCSACARGRECEGDGGEGGGGVAGGGGGG